jgi:hypothetical protein
MLGLFEPGRLIDLGAGHGAFSIMAADAGWKVTALDARKKRFQEDERIEWKVGDVRDADFSQYDVIACLGLFYHLTVDDQLDLLKRAAGTPIILDTHVANGQPCPFPLSDEVELSGFKGQLFTEADQSKHPTASWGNDDSFWARPDELYRMFAEHGYTMLEAQPWYLPTRTFWLCIPAEPTRSTARKTPKRSWWKR